MKAFVWPFSPITEEIESCSFEPPNGATLALKTNIGKITKGSQICQEQWLFKFYICQTTYRNENSCIDLGLKILTHFLLL